MGHLRAKDGHLLARKGHVKVKCCCAAPCECDPDNLPLTFDLSGHVVIKTGDLPSPFTVADTDFTTTLTMTGDCEYRSPMFYVGGEDEQGNVGEFGPLQYSLGLRQPGTYGDVAFPCGWVLTGGYVGIASPPPNGESRNGGGVNGVGGSYTPDLVQINGGYEACRSSNLVVS